MSSTESSVTSLRNAGTSEATAKPKSTLLVQIGGAILGVLFLVGVARLFLYAISHSAASWHWSNLTLAAGWRLASAVVLLFMIRAVQRRTLMGRVLGLAFIAATFVWMTYLQITPHTVPSYAPSYSDPAFGKSVEAAVSLASLCFIGWWFYAFGFSRAARKYFSS